MNFCKQKDNIKQYICLEYSKKRGESICEVELWAANVIKVTDDTGRWRVIVIEEDYSTIHEYEIKFLNKENIYNVQWRKQLCI